MGRIFGILECLTSKNSKNSNPFSPSDDSKNHYEKELKFHQDDLQKLTNALNLKKTEYTQYMNNIELLEKQVEEYQAEATQLRSDTDLAIEEEKGLVEIINILKQQIKKLDEDYQEMVKEKDFLKQSIDNENKASKTKLEQLKEAHTITQKNLLEVQDETKKIQMDIEDAKEDQIICQQHVDQSQRETDRLINEKERTEKELTACQKEQVALNSKMALLQLQLDQETKRIYGIETKLKSQVDALRRTQQTNFQAKLTMEDKIERAKNELNKILKDNARKEQLANEKVRSAEQTAEKSKQKLTSARGRFSVG